ncbi:MAG: FG-GAP repeat domain-containing protein [Planctomycetota bacterium]|jgi:hypothetical protein
MPTLPVILVLLAPAPPIPPASLPRDAPEIHPDHEHVVIAADSNFEACGVADFDRDGDLDIVCGDAWYASPDWTRNHIGLIRSVGGYRVDFADVPMDVDGDGWMDVVSCSWHDRGVFWRRNPGETGGDWKMQVIDRPGNMETAIAADVDGDGRLDFLPNTVNSTVWYSLDDGRLVPHVISPDRGGHGVGAGDVDGDGRSDILGPNGWFEAPENAREGVWRFHDEWSLGGAGISIIVHDFDGDGLADVFWGMGHDYGLFWLKQGRDDTGTRTWTRRLVDDSWSQAHGLVLVDLGGDGTSEVVTGKRRHAHNGKDPGGEDELLVCSYRFDPVEGGFAKQVLSRGGDVGAGHYPVVIDLDDDGDLDLVLPGKSGLHLLRNRRTPGQHGMSRP